MDIQVEFRLLQFIWVLVALFHIIKPDFGFVSSSFNSWVSSSLVNPCGKDKVLMKFPSHLILIIEFKVNTKRN